MKYYKSSSWLKMLHEQFYIIEKDFELQFSDNGNTFSVNLAPGTNIFMDNFGTKTIYVDEILNFENDICYKVNPNFKIMHEKYKMKINFIPNDNGEFGAPKYVEMYVTSKNNSYGIHLGIWDEFEEYYSIMELNRASTTR